VCGVPRDGDGPIFAEPWQAQAFALTVQLSQAGCFTWQEWADELAAVLRDSAVVDPHDDGGRYYDYWLVALERMCLGKGVINGPALDRRTTDWAEAYHRTPHGQPVQLSRA
jgi:nitrile hydratase accessory protein